MNERTLNFKLFVADGLRRVGGSAQKVFVTEDLIKLAKSARKSYQNYLERQKEFRKNGEEERHKLENEEQQKEQPIAEMSSNKEMIKALEETLKEKKEALGTKEKATDQVLQEARNRLKKGTQKNNMVEIQLAQATLDGSLALRNDQKKFCSS